MKNVSTDNLISELRVRAIKGEADPEELLAIFNLARDTRARLAAAQFNEGNRVVFVGRKSGPHAGHLEGTVVSVNPKSVTVEVNIQNGKRLPFPQKWTVTASVLKLKAE